MLKLRRLKGRGALTNPANRFDGIEVEYDADCGAEFNPSPRTELLRDTSRTAITYNKSPDIPFEASLNPYRGCEHGCIYCYARPFHEYLGFSAGIDFETKIVVKEDLDVLLRKELSSPRWEPKVIALSGVTDPYQPLERVLKVTRRCLSVLAEFRNPVCIVTKSSLVTRDVDILVVLAKYDAVVVYISLTTLDSELSHLMEPRASQPKRRIRALEVLSSCGVPCGVLVAPVIPGLNDHEIPTLLAEAAKAGARYAGYVPIRLPFGVKDLFVEWLSTHFPARKSKVLSKIRSMKGGRLNDTRFFHRMGGEGAIADYISSLFEVTCRRWNLVNGGARLSAASFMVPEGLRSDHQLVLFD
ncbi:MAG: PA0069 family radical SAM protein [Candidatus Caldarchaeum sp.]